MSSRILKYHVRELLDYTEDEIWDIKPNQMVELTLDDGEVVQCPVYEMQMSYYAWRIVDAYRELQITKRLLVNGRPFTDDLFRDLMWAAIEPTRDMEDIDKEDVWAIAYEQIYNGTYNAIVTRLSDYVSGLNAEHIVEITNDPEIAAANAQVTDDLGSTDRVYQTLDRVLKSNKYESNPIVRAIQNRTVKAAQIYQSFGPRGRATDIDSVIYRRPVRRGFAMGLTFNDYAKESRSAAKSLLFNKDPVAHAEYFNRKLQLVTNVIVHLIHGDCGTTDAHEWFVPNDKYGKSLLRSLDGQLQVLPDNKFKKISSNDETLLGTHVRFRTSLCCRYSKKQAICSACYGPDLAYATTYDANPGHVSCTTVNKSVTQLIISTKHLDFIDHTFVAHLSGNETRYLNTRTYDMESLFVAPERSRDKLQIRIFADEAPMLIDIKYVSNVHNLDISKITSLTYAEFFLIDKDGYISDEQSVNLVKQETKASFSIALLKYIKEHGWTKHNQYYVVTLEDWDNKKPLFTYPNMHESTSEYASRLETFIRSSRSRASEDGPKEREVQGRRRLPMLTGQAARDVDVALRDALYIISEKIKDVPIGHIATILLASRATDPANNDWSLPGGLHRGQFCAHEELIRNRDLAAALLFERQADVYNDVRSYVHKNRVYSPMQSLIYIPSKMK